MLLLSSGFVLVAAHAVANELFDRGDMSGPVIVATEQLQHSALPWVIGRALIVNFLKEICAQFTVCRPWTTPPLGTLNFPCVLRRIEEATQSLPCRGMPWQQFQPFVPSNRNLSLLRYNEKPLISRCTIPMSMWRSLRSALLQSP